MKALIWTVVAVAVVTTLSGGCSTYRKTTTIEQNTERVIGQEPMVTGSAPAARTAPGTTSSTTITKEEERVIRTEVGVN